MWSRRAKQTLSCSCKTKDYKIKIDQQSNDQQNSMAQKIGNTTFPFFEIFNWFVFIYFFAFAMQISSIG